MKLGLTGQRMMAVLVLLFASWLLWRGPGAGTRPISLPLAAVLVVTFTLLAARRRSYERAALFVMALAFAIAGLYERLGAPWWTHLCVAIISALLLLVHQGTPRRHTPWAIVLAAVALIAAVLFWV